MFEDVSGNLTSSFNGIFSSLVEPNRTLSYKVEFVNSKYLESFPGDFCQGLKTLFHWK